MLHLEHLAKVYGDRVVLRDVNASFAAGSVSLLAGNNGAGKSTLLRIVAGLARATSGTVRLADPAPVTAYLGHATFLYPGLSALENHAFWNGVHELRRSRQELLDLLEHVGLAAHAHERAGVFSRGMAHVSIWRGCSCCRRTCCCWTNPAPAWTPPRWPCCDRRYATRAGGARPSSS